MRKPHNVKTSFARQVETFVPEMAALRALPKVTHLWTRHQVLADLESFLDATELVHESTGSVPVFHVPRREVCLDFCLPGVMGERISS